jgi:hydroxyacylglutathione hydrolase
MSYAIIDSLAGPEVVGVFTGDALFVGEVGRTDLMGHDRIAELAAMLFDSLHQKLLPLGRRTIIFPAHGAGSACGGSISNREESTIGLEMSQNKMLGIKDKESFVAKKVQEKIEKPFYFSTMEEINLRGQPVLGHMPTPPSLSPNEFKEMASGQRVVLDVRVPTAFASAHVEGALSIPMEVMPNYAGWMLDYDRPLLLVMDENGDVRKVVSELVRIGYVNIAGYLRDGMEGWAKAGLPISSFPAITAQDLYARREAGEDIFFLDVRMDKEWAVERIDGAKHIFVGFLDKRLNEVPRDRPIAVMCSSGLRGSLGASVLQRNGYIDPINVLGGMGGWKKAGLPVVK